jgi:hypothetical protein
MSFRKGLGSMGYAVDPLANPAIKNRISMQGFMPGQVLYYIPQTLFKEILYLV